MTASTHEPSENNYHQQNEYPPRRRHKASPSEIYENQNELLPPHNYLSEDEQKKNKKQKYE